MKSIPTVKVLKISKVQENSSVKIPHTRKLVFSSFYLQPFFLCTFNTDHPFHKTFLVFYFSNSCYFVIINSNGHNSPWWKLKFPSVFQPLGINLFFYYYVLHILNCGYFNTCIYLWFRYFLNISNYRNGM